MTGLISVQYVGYGFELVWVDFFHPQGQLDGHLAGYADFPYALPNNLSHTTQLVQHRLWHKILVIAKHTFNIR